MKTIGWGILGCGNIAEKFAIGLRAVESAALVGVGSRTLAKAQSFAAKFGAARAFGSYDSLAQCAEIDAIYIATPPHLHLENTLLCLEAGKAVLCEKPFALNAGQAQQMADAAKNRGLFLMEAMWTRFLPAIQAAKTGIKNDEIGPVRLIQADFGYAMGFDSNYMVFNPQMGGGALMDVGIYPLSLAAFLGGAVEEIGGVCLHVSSGVDGVCAFSARLQSGALAQGASATQLDTPQSARIIGEKGQFEIPQFWHAQSLIMHRKGDSQSLDFPFEANGYEYQAREVGRCLRQGEIQSDIMPPSESVALMAAMDTLRRSWGLKMGESSVDNTK